MDWMISRIVSGVLLLFLGRRLFWLFVGLIGFLAGAAFSTRFFDLQPEWMKLLIALGCGIVGIFVAIFLQRLAIAVAGFLAGGFFATNLLEVAGWNIEPTWIFLIGGILGAILLSVWFDWALIFLSSLTGAFLIAQAVPWRPLPAMILFFVLFFIGILVQARIPRARRIPTDSDRELRK